MRCPTVVIVAGRSARGGFGAAIGLFSLLLGGIAGAQLPPLPLPSLPLPLFTPTPAPSTTPSSTTTPTANGSPTPTFDVSATPVAGGSVHVTATVDLLANDGDTVSGGSFEVRNSSNGPVTIQQVAIDASDPTVVASLTLTGTTANSSQVASVSSPSSSNVFVFDPGLDVAAGDAAQFALSVTVAGTPASSLVPTAEVTSVVGTPTPTPLAGETPTTTPLATVTPQPTTTPFGTAASAPVARGVVAAALVPAPATPAMRGLAATGALLMICALAIGDDRKRRVVRMVGSLLFTLSVLAWIARFTGCGGQEQTVQTITGVSGVTGSGPVSFSGVPASLGSVSRPEQLTFPGNSAVAGATPTPTI